MSHVSHGKIKIPFEAYEIEMMKNQYWRHHINEDKQME
jgi:hypothetical protein